MSGTGYRLTETDEADMLARLRDELERLDPDELVDAGGRDRARHRLVVGMARAIGCGLADLRYSEKVWMHRHAYRAVNLAHR